MVKLTKMFKKRAKFRVEKKSNKDKYIFINEVEWGELPRLNSDEVIKFNYNITKKERLDFNGEEIHDLIIEKVFDFAYDMTFGKKGKHRSKRSGGESNRHNGEIFSNVFQGKLAEFGVYIKMSNIYTNEKREISYPDLKEYDLGVWDKYDLMIDDLKLAIKSTKNKGNLLLLETEDWTAEGLYKHNIDGGKIEYDAIILSRVGAKTKEDVTYSNIAEIMRVYLYKDFEEEAPREDLKKLIFSHKWFYDIPGFITTDMLVEVISNEFIINKGDILLKSTLMDATNYYVKASQMLNIEGFKENFNYEEFNLNEENYIYFKVFNCPICGSSIKIDLSGYVTDESSYERQMGAEIEHNIEAQEICSTCNYEYKIDGAIWEYPVGAENYNDLKIN